MRQFLIAIGTAGLFGLGAQAGPVCASPVEMKALQAAVLQQQLAAAAQDCRAADEYARFMAAYRDAMMKSDQTVRAFFGHQRSGETYDAYKSRIAHEIRRESLHDSKFCDTAKTIFDVALGRAKPAKPPTLMRTGYEGCRLVPDKPQLAATPQPRPPVPNPAPSVKAAEIQPQWDADHVLALLRPVDVPIPTPSPLHSVRALALAPSAPRPVPSVVSPKPHLAGAQVPSPAAGSNREVSHVTESLARRESHPEVGHRASQYATVEHPRRQDAEESFNDGGNVPNAYRPGARWLGAEADDPPPGRFDEAQPPLYRGPDGRWYRRIWRDDRRDIGRDDRWDDDEDE